MSRKVKLFYACTDIPAKSFVLLIDRQATFGDLLKVISERRKKTYISIFYYYSQIDECEVIQDFLEDDTDFIFFVSTTDEEPDTDFVQSIIDSKKKRTQEKHDSEFNRSENDKKDKTYLKKHDSEANQSENDKNSDTSSSSNDMTEMTSNKNESTPQKKKKELKHYMKALNLTAPFILQVVR